MASQPFHPRPDALPGIVGVFPLPGALLLPRCRLPLNVFEPRYLRLVLDCLGEGRMLGMIQPDGADPDADVPGLFRVGCLGRVSSFSETDDGRLLVTLVGVARFRVEAELEGRGGYRRVRASYGEWLGDLGEPEEAGLDRDRVVEALRPYFRARRIEVNWDAIAEVPDSHLVTTMAMVCPFDPREKQALLEAPDTAERARVLIALLQMEALGGTPEGKPS